MHACGVRQGGAAAHSMYSFCAVSLSFPAAAQAKSFRACPQPESEVEGAEEGLTLLLLPCIPLCAACSQA